MKGETEVTDFEVETDSFRLKPDDEEGIGPIWATLSEKLLGEKPSDRQVKLKEFKIAVMEDYSLHQDFKEKVDSAGEGYSLRFLRAGAWDVKFALQVFQAYCGLGEKYPQYLAQSMPSKLGRFWSQKLDTMSEKRDKFGRRVYIFRLGKWNPDTVPIEEFYGSAFVLFELVAREVKTQISGCTVVCELTGFSFKHIRNIGVEQIRCLADVLSGAFPLWFHRIHVINHPRIFNILFNMIKPFLNDRVKDNIIFHGNDVTSLHKEVCPNILPADLGGSGDLDNTACVSAAKLLEADYVEFVSRLTNKR